MKITEADLVVHGPNIKNTSDLTEVDIQFMRNYLLIILNTMVALCRGLVMLS